MKKIFGWILIILGGFFCYVFIMGIAVTFIIRGMMPGERIGLFVFCVIAAVGAFFLFLAGLKLKRNDSGQRAPAGAAKKSPVRTDTFRKAPVLPWMTSQLPALYLKSKDESYHELYIQQLGKIGFSTENAGKMFDFECDVIRKYGKEELLQPTYAQSWMFDLKQPIFTQYPEMKEDLLKEMYFTMSELCKLIDEAEWHFWNSHENVPSNAVWREIAAWRLKGAGGQFAAQYFSAMEEKTGIPAENIGQLCALQGRDLCKKKWS